MNRGLTHRFDEPSHPLVSSRWSDGETGRTTLIRQHRQSSGGKVVKRSISGTTSARVITAGLLGVGLTSAIWSQAPSAPPPSPTPATGAATSTDSKAGGRSIVIERAPVIFRDPGKYQVNLHLLPARRLSLTSSVDGVVSSIQTKLGSEIASQAEAVRLDASEAQLHLLRAQAARKAAQAELDGANNKAAAEARLEVADADLKLAELRQSRSIIRTPLQGIVTSIHVVVGEFVRAGQPLVDVIDTTELFVDVPVEGQKQNVGDPIELRIEDSTVTGQLQSVLPLTTQFDSLRELVPSPATGRVVLPNSAGKWRAGQTVYSPLIPRFPVAEVPTGAVQNADQGTRKVQVIREGFVRDVPVSLLGQIGGDYIFVSGRFGVNDELIVKSSETLLDGARVTSRAPQGANNSPQPARPVQPTTGGGNF